VFLALIQAIECEKEKSEMTSEDTDRGRPKHRWLRIVAIAVVLLAAIGGYWYLTEGWAWLYGTQAYIYGFPMIMMDLTKETSTAVSKPGEFTAPANQFSVMTHYPDASFHAVARTGLDTLFAVSWADLDKEPLVLSVPDTHGRYYVIALFDMWSNVFASIGKRNTGTGAANFLIVGPGWQGDVPVNVERVFHSPTRCVWVNGQMQADGPRDYDAVNALQHQYKLTPLSAWGKPYTPPAEVAVNGSVDTKTPPLTQVQKMDANAYFSRLARLMKDNPPASVDAAMVKKLRKLGIEPGKNFDVATLDVGTARGLERAMTTFALLEKGVKQLHTVNGWIVMPKDMADYGADYTTRAGIALVGLGAIQPHDVVYPTAFSDGDDKPLDSSKRYVLHFDKGQLPPSKATWSVSVYDPDGFYVPNSINRYNLAAWMPLQFNPDGSLDIYIQSNSPEAGKEANWLPAPASGPFNLTVRNYWPTETVLDGTYKMPPVKAAQ
jgi:hypothetical protein